MDEDGTFDLEAARAAFPDDPADLPAAAQATFAAWMSVSGDIREQALRKAAEDGFPRPGAPYMKQQKARDLTLLRTAFPASAGTGGRRRVLTPAQVAEIAPVSCMHRL